MKVCTKCNTKKALTEFRKKSTSPDGLQYTCVSCNKKYHQHYYSLHKTRLSEKNKEWKEKNKEHSKKYHKQYRQEHKKHLRDQAKERYYKSHEENLQKQALYRQKNRKILSEKQAKYRVDPENKQKINNYAKSRRAEDPLFRALWNIRRIVPTALRRGGYSKRSRAYLILGIDYPSLKVYLESTYYSRYGEHTDWVGVHIDHIIPISMATNEQEILELNHWTNLQLLKAKDNLRKSNSLEDPSLQSYS